MTTEAFLNSFIVLITIRNRKIIHVNEKNSAGDMIMPCRTPLDIVKSDDFMFPHRVHICWGRYQLLKTLTKSEGTPLSIVTF